MNATLRSALQPRNNLINPAVPEERPLRRGDCVPLSHNKHVPAKSKHESDVRTCATSVPNPAAKCIPVIISPSTRGGITPSVFPGLRSRTYHRLPTVVLDVAAYLAKVARLCPKLQFHVTVVKNVLLQHAKADDGILDSRECKHVTVTLNDGDMSSLF